MSWLALSASFEYICYGSTVTMNMFTLTVWGSNLDVRICRLHLRVLENLHTNEVNTTSLWHCNTTLQSQKAVAAYSKSKDLLPFGFAEQNTWHVEKYVTWTIICIVNGLYVTEGELCSLPHIGDQISPRVNRFHGVQRRRIRKILQRDPENNYVKCELIRIKSYCDNLNDTDAAAS